MSDTNNQKPTESRLTNRPFLVLISLHWLSLLGTALLGTALISWLFILPFGSKHAEQNPYIGILVFFVVPAVFFLGLILIPAGVWLAKRHLRHHIDTYITDPKVARRRLLRVLGIVTVLNVIAGTQFTYHAVEHMESVQFCGQSCHVMKPEFMAYQESPHSRVDCVGCHVAPGAKGFFDSKMSGTRQLYEVTMNNFPRPIPTALESGRLVPSKETCEQCHWANEFAGVRLKVISHFAEDETNTQTKSVLLMLIGGSNVKGIHGSHFGPGVKIRFAASDPKRQTIPWVEYTNSVTGKTQEFYASSAKPESVSKLPVNRMQCVDCHNRPTHAFELPERAVDKAMADGSLPTTLPFLRKQAIVLLKTKYASNDEATNKIPNSIIEFYKKSYPDVSGKRSGDIELAAKTVTAIYNRNVFPELKVDWGTYPNNLGHTDFPGCFRCHDEDHTAKGGKTITQDCGTCHVPLAMEESDPEVLKTLGLNDLMAAMQKQ